MSTVLLVIQIMIAVAMVVVILVQRSSSDGLGGLGGGGGGNAFLSGRASANLLTRTTAILAALFIINSLALGAIASRSSDKASLIESIEKNDAAKAKDQAPDAATTGETPATDAEKKDIPASPSVPIAE